MTHSAQTISPLRQRMIDDMVLRKLSPKTQKQYIRAVKSFTRSLGRSPDKMLRGGWLFPGQNPVNPLSTRQLRRAIESAVSLAGLEKSVSLHSLRHAFATHLSEAMSHSLEVADIFRTQGAALNSL